MHLPAKANSLSVKTFVANKSLSDSDSNIPKMSVNRDVAAVCPVENHSNRLPAVGFLASYFNQVITCRRDQSVVTLFIWLWPCSGPMFTSCSRESVTCIYNIWHVIYCS